jgi:putative salt-induced outer membrane protein YdiY
MAILVITGFLACMAVGRADDVPPASPPADSDVVKDWHGSIALGLSVTQGNSKTLTGNGAFNLAKLWKTDEWSFGADGQYGVNDFGTKTNEVINAENIHGFVDYKRLFDERLYGSARVDAWHDDVADLQNREVIGPALGYYFIKTDASRLAGEVGASYEHQRQGGIDQDFFTVRLNEHGQHTWGKQAKVWEDVTYLPKVDDFNVYLLVTDVGAEASMTTQLSLRVVFQDRYNSAPASGRVPNDLAILASLVCNFGQAK